MSVRRVSMLRVWLALLFLAMAAPATAHLTPNSEIRLDIGRDKVMADIILPRGEYAYGTGNPVTNDARALNLARDYVLRHFAVRAPDGRQWQVAARTVEFVQIEGPPDLHLIAELTPPAGSRTRRFTIDWHVLVDDLPSHFALFVLDGGGKDGGRKILGAVRTGSPPLTVTAAAQGPFTALRSAITLGAHHILGGYDHLMFLLALLLPAPLVAQGGAWRSPRPVGQTIGQLTRIVTAFTIGHSLTLVGATLGHWRLPAAPVEVAIAVSVLVSAIHAYRPLLPGREPLIALFFGLIHGLAFATLIQQAGAGMASGAASLFGFNLGIELVQLAIVAAVVPSLIVLSRGPLYQALRPVLAILCAYAAIAWIVNRTTGAGDDLVATNEAVLAQSGWFVLALALVALFAWFRQSARRGPTQPLTPIAVP